MQPKYKIEVGDIVKTKVAIDLDDYEETLSITNQIGIITSIMEHVSTDDDCYPVIVRIDALRMSKSFAFRELTLTPLSICHKKNKVKSDAIQN